LVVYCFAAEAKYWLLGILVGQIIATFFYWKACKKDLFKKELSKSHFFSKDLLTYSLPIVMSTLFIWFQTQGYRVVVDKLVGAEILALLSVPLALAASASGVIEGIISQYYHPEFYAELKYDDARKRSLAWESLWKKSVGLYLPSMFYVAALGDIWLRILTAPAYHSTAYLFKWAVFAELLRMLGYIIHSISLSEKQTRKSIIPHMIVSFVIILGLFILGKFYSESLVSFIPALLVVGYLVGLLFAYFYMRSLMVFSLSFHYLIKQLFSSVPFLIWALLANYFDFWIQCLVALPLTAYLYFLVKKHLNSVFK
jgi:O-antigen/teichoic acid export membrane protein